MSEEKGPGGRPTKYKPDYHPQKARELAEQGLIDKQIADFFGIDESTLYNWKREYLEFFQAVEEGKQPQLKEIEEAAYKAALWNQIEEETIYYDKEGNETGKKIIKKPLPPNSKIACLMLMSRFGDKYKMKTEQTNIDPLKKKVQDMTPEEREARIKELEEERKKND